MSNSHESLVDTYHKYLEKKKEKMLREGRKPSQGQSLGKLLSKTLKTEVKESKKVVPSKHRIKVLPDALTREEEWREKGLKRKRFKLNCDRCISTKRNPCPYFSLAKTICHNFTEKGGRRK